MLTTHPYLAPRLKKEYSYTSTPLLGFHGMFWGELDVTLQKDKTIRCTPRQYVVSVSEADTAGHGCVMLPCRITITLGT